MIVRALLCVLLACGCADRGSGAACQLDSDCEGSLVCGLDSRCVAAACAVNATCPDAGVVGDTGPACPPPSERLTANAIVMEKSGGVVLLADNANAVITDAIESGGSVVELWTVDGVEFWTTHEHQQNDDCTPYYGVDFPLPIPMFGGFTSIVTEVDFDRDSGTLKGLIDEEQLLSNIPEGQLRDVADGLIEKDVDTDGDGAPDMVSVTILITFAAAE